ncbi:MAG: ABC transporter permease, partial [Candidatus Limnocylindrales bacterium]
MTRSLVVRRLLHAIPVLLIVAVGVFVLLELAPGDAVDAYLGQTGTGDAALAEQLRQAWGLDQSVWVRFLAYMQSVLTLDLGWSTAAGAPVTEAILTRLPTTLLLMGSAVAITEIVGTLLGELGAM